MSEITPTTPSEIVSSLLAGLAYNGGQESRHDPKLPLSSKNILLTLHILFPHHLLDALDLLDRGLVMRLLGPKQSPGERSVVEYHVRSAQVPSSSSSWRDRTKRSGGEHDASNEPNVNSHHVRLVAWHCSCPGFAYAAFTQSLHLDAGSSNASLQVTPAEAEMAAFQQSVPEGVPGAWASSSFGGMPNTSTTQGQSSDGIRAGRSGLPPICKHLFACILAETCGNVFDGARGQGTDNSGNELGSGSRERLVTEHEAAGWAAAGWHL